MKDPLTYVHNVIEEDFGHDIEYLTALVLFVCGRPPVTARPFNVISTWKQLARKLLMDTVPEATRPIAERYAHLVVLLVCRRAGVVFTGQSRDGWEVEYNKQIKAARRIGRGLLTNRGS
jgi:hypothetical protein